MALKTDSFIPSAAAMLRWVLLCSARRNRTFARCTRMLMTNLPRRCRVLHLVANHAWRRVQPERFGSCVTENPPRSQEVDYYCLEVNFPGATFLRKIRLTPQPQVS